ncbi:MAG TPA: AMP-binding protein [Burkholderiaceae bacterium]|nr:AMP-binding protein [Burkholderiaceae bacterium]
MRVADTFARDHLPPQSEWPEFLFDRAEYRYRQQVNCVSELLDRQVDAGHGARPAITALVNGRAMSCTYAQLQAQVNRIARVLTEEMELVPGSRVLLRAPNTPMLAACWLAVVKAGLIAVGSMPLLRARELKQMIDKARIGTALCDARLKDDLASLLNAASEHHAPDLKTVVYFNDTGADSLEARVAGKPIDFTAHPSHRDDVCLIAFTSGTTGEPKGTVHFHRDILVMADAFTTHVLKPTCNDVFCGTPPLAFTFGLGGLLAMPLRFGASTVLIEKPTPETLLAAIESTRATICFTAPTMYRQMALLLADAARTFDISSLHKTVSAGEMLPDATRSLWKQATGIDMIDGIGATEMIHIFIAAAGSDIRAGAIGKAVPGYRPIVVDDAMNELPRGTTGKLAVKGPTGCRYLDDDRQRSYVRDGWNLTGDTFVHDDEGYFRYQARSDAMIVTSGYNVAGPEVEGALLLHPAVAECGVIGVADQERGQRVVAYVVLKSGHARSENLCAELQAFVKRTIAPYKYPRTIRFVDSLPRTETGKLQHFRLREHASS